MGNHWHVDNLLAPQLGHELVLRVGSGESRETHEGRSTYCHQLEAFTRGVREGALLPTGGADAVANMRVIDAAYRAAGLPIRRRVPSAPPEGSVVASA